MQKELQTKAEAYDKAKATMPTAKQEETERELNDMYQKIQQTAQRQPEGLQRRAAA